VLFYRLVTWHGARPKGLDVFILALLLVVRLVNPVYVYFRLF
jgi:hypothetical protein